MTNLRHISFLYMFISILYMFRAFMCLSSGDLIVSIRYLVYVTLAVRYTGLGRYIKTYIPDGHLHRVTNTRYLIDTIESPDDEHLNARNLYRIEINIYKKEMCVVFVIEWNYTEMHGQQNIKFSWMNYPVYCYIDVSVQLIKKCLGLEFYLQLLYI